MADPNPLPAAKKLLFSLVTTALVLGAVEFGFRLNGYGRRVITVNDADVGARLVPSQDRTTERGQHIHVNALGMRDEEFPREKPEGEFRILLLGDSLTFGIDVEQDETFPRLLHQRLRERCPQRPVRVMNAGVPGYDSKQEHDWLVKFGFALQPDVVLVMFYPNDVEFNERKLAALEFPLRDLLRHTATFEAMERKHVADEAQRLGSSGEIDKLRKQQLADMIRRYKGTATIDPNDPAEKQRTKLAKNLLDDMAKLCAARNVRFAVCMIPGFANTKDPKLPNIAAGFEYEFGREGVKCLNLLPALADHHAELWLEWDEGHFAPAGHRYAAEAIERWLLESGFLPFCG